MRADQSAATRSATLWLRLGSAAVCAGLLLTVLQRGGPAQGPASGSPPAPAVDPAPTAEGAVRVSPSSAVAGEHGTWTVSYTAGPSGVAEGGGVRIQLPAIWHAVGRNSGHRLQASDPSDANYVQARCSNPNVELRTIVELESAHTLGKAVKPSNLVGRAGYYEYVTRVMVAKGRVREGDVLSVVYGETAGGSRGMQVGFRASASQPVTLALDIEGNGRFRLHSDRPQLSIEAGPAVDLRLSTRSQVGVGEPAMLHVAVLDEYANPVTSFAGPVEVSIEGEAFRETLDIRAGRGWGELSYTPRKTGIVRFRATEATRSLDARGNPLEVLPEPPREPIYWGDLHSHTRLSSADGVGVPSDAYIYARRVSGLDFYAMTDHSGGDCEKLRERLCPDEWEDYLTLADRYDAPGAFVALKAYEASFGAPYGHHNIYFRDKPGPLLDPDKVTLPELWKALQAREALTIPHHTLKMPEVVDWSEADDPELRRNFEIYSAHGLSEEFDPTHPLAFEQSLFTNPSTSTRTGMSAHRAWIEGYELSAIAASDDHRAQPGQAHFGLTAVRAAELTREGVFDALYNRQTYATTGERILLEFAINGVGMGGRVRESKKLSLRLRAVGTDVIDRVEILRHIKGAPGFAVVERLSPATEVVELARGRRSGGRGDLLRSPAAAPSGGRKARHGMVFAHLGQSRGRVRPALPTIGALMTSLMQISCTAEAPPLQWEVHAALPSARGSYVSGFVGDRLVLAGGTFWQDGVKLWRDGVAAYDPLTDAWEALPAMPRPVGYAAGATADGALYVFGGDGPEAPEQAWFRLSLVEGEYRWAEIASPPAHRSYAQAVVLNDELYLLGGSETFSDLSTASPAAFKRSLNPPDPEWKALAPMPGEGRAIFAAAACRSEIYVFGGCNVGADGKLRNLKSAYKYDPAADRWQPLADLPVATRAWSAAALDDRYIFLFGGFSGDSDASGRFESRVYRYDVSLDRYEEMPGLPGANCDMAFHLWRGVFYGAGGEPGPKRRSNATWSARICRGSCGT